MKKKYELTDKKITIHNHILYRIQALKDFSNIKAGDLGGFIESRSNLSPSGNCWAFDNSCIYGNARVSGRACIFDNAQIYGNAQVYDRAHVSENAIVCGGAHVFINSDISGNASIVGLACVGGAVKISYGVWNKIIHMHNNWYLISPTLQKILLELTDDSKI